MKLDLDIQLYFKGHTVGIVYLDVEFEKSEEGKEELKPLPELNPSDVSCMEATDLMNLIYADYSDDQVAHYRRESMKLLGETGINKNSEN